METTQDAVAILRLMVAPYGSRIEAKALVHAIEELTKRQTLPAENEKIRASRDRWREVAEQFVDGLTKDDKALAGAVKAYTKLIKVPADAAAQ
jgi:hypothetical protein